MTIQEQVKALTGIVNALIPYKENTATTKVIKDAIKDVDLYEVLNTLRQAEQSYIGTNGSAQARPLPQPASRPAVTVTGKQYFHEVNKRGERCFELQKQWEDDNGVHVEDAGSLPFLAQRPARCARCPDVIGIGEEMIVRQRS
jgi:hypothetical protein